MVDFGCVEERGAVVQTLELVNSSPVEAIYQWDLDCSGHSVFSMQPASGTVRPHSRTTLKAVYRPTQPIAHHRRVACFILHRVGEYKCTNIIKTIDSMYLPKWSISSCRTLSSLTWLVPVTQSSRNQLYWNPNTWFCTGFSGTADRSHQTLSLPCSKTITYSWTSRGSSVHWRR